MANRKPKISVIMPVYNVAGWVGEAVRSVLAQTYTDFEFIIIDDGSSDATARIVSRIQDTRIRFFKRPHLGTVYQLNFGLDHARGVYIARQDGDDYSHPERFGRQVRFLEAHPEFGVVSMAMQLIDAHDGSLGILTYPREPDHAQLMQKCCISHPAAMWRREINTHLGGYDERFNRNCCEDYDFWLRVAEHYRLYVLDEVLYTKREHPQSSIQLNRKSEVPVYDALARNMALGRIRGAQRDIMQGLSNAA